MNHLSIAVIGAGGKTTTMRTLARHFSNRSVLFTTTTHIFPLEDAECRHFLPDPTDIELLSSLSQPGVICTGTTVKLGKLGALPPDLMRQAMDVADVTLYEADGANRLPLKLHREGEPVVLPNAHRCIIVAGLSALGKPISETVHRYQLEPAWAQHPDVPADEAVFLRCILDAVRTSHLPSDRLRILLNQADKLSDLAPAKAISFTLEQMGFNCRIGSLHQNSDFLTPWVLEG